MCRQCSAVQYIRGTLLRSTFQKRRHDGEDSSCHALEVVILGGMLGRVLWRQADLSYYRDRIVYPWRCW